ncbi:MAG: metal-dependent hydrolase [Anaerolineae bacterium]|nr:metal-dependent hydrolase [Anaerolineae bacterium]
MSISFTWLGHSAFQFEIDGHSIIADPFLSGNPAATVSPTEVNPEIIFLSHAHGDHYGDTVDIAKRTGVKVVANNEIANYIAKQGADTHGQNPGGSFDHGFVTAKWTVAFHSSSFPDGTYGGEANGFILTGKDSGMKLYFAGDTALFSDMALIGDHDIDVAFLPIGDNFTMGIEDSVKAVQFIRPRYVVPMHYNTFPLLQQDANAWAEQVKNETTAIPVVLPVNGSFELD